MSEEKSLLSDEDRSRIELVRHFPGTEFSSLVAAADLDPSMDLRFSNLSGVDFSGSDLRGYNFTGANLSKTNWTSATYDETTIVRDAVMDSVIGFVTKQSSIKHTPAQRPKADGYQFTLKSSVTLSGIGVHSGLPLSITIGPAPIDTGYLFVRNDLESGRREVKALAEFVVSTNIATVLGDREGPLVSSAEIVLAPLRGLGVDNAIIELDGPEVPVMDGSAAAYVAAIDQAGVIKQSAPRRYLQVLKPIRVESGESFAELRPHATGLRIEVEVDYPHFLIGKQSFAVELNPDSFRREVSRARIFGFMEDISRLWGAGYALGASFDNTIVFDETRILNPEGLRFADECVRHTALDLIGDLALAGFPILGACQAVRGGHKLHYAVLEALMADKSAWRKINVRAPRNQAHEAPLDVSRQ